MDDIRGSGIVSSAVDVLRMSVVRGMRGFSGVCEMCMCMARSGVDEEEGVWMRGFGLGAVGTGECLRCVWVAVV